MAIQITREVDRLVVLDAPAYRRLVGQRHSEKALEKIEEIVAEERPIGIQPIGYSTVLMELLAPLADPDAGDYESAKAAALVACRHCRIPTKDGGEDVAVWASSGLQLSLSLFHEWPDELLETDDRVRSVVERLSESPDEETVEACRDDLEALAARLATWRDTFAKTLKKHVDEPISEGAMARAHVRRAASHLPDEISDDEVKRMARWLARKFEVAVAMYRQIVEDAREEGRKLTSERTTELLWNLQVAFLVGETHKLDGKPADVLSGDDEIVAAARACGLGGKVIPIRRYAEYREKVGEEE